MYIYITAKHLACVYILDIGHHKGRTQTPSWKRKLTSGIDTDTVT